MPAKAGGLHSQGAEGAAVVHLLQALGNTGYGALRLLQRLPGADGSRIYMNEVGSSIIPYATGPEG
jgi:UDP-N-acetylenolpyruvoylglucosamine reductase